jgi:hypothetical protein
MTPLLAAVRRGDVNAPSLVLTPVWGPDKYSLRMAIRRFLFGSPAGPASWGIGPRPAPAGASVTENSKTDGWLPPQQSFTGMTAAIGNPALRTLRSTASFPSADVQVNPVLLAFDVDQNVGW